MWCLGVVVLTVKCRVSLSMFHCKSRILTMVPLSAAWSSSAKDWTVWQFKAQALRLELACFMMCLAVL